VCAFITNADAVMVHSFWKEVIKNSIDQVMRPYSEGDARHDLLMFAPASITTIVFRRECIDCKELVFDRELRLAEDHDFIYRVSRYGRVALIRKPLTIVHIHESNTLRNPDEIAESQMRVIANAFKVDTTGLAARSVYEANVSAYRRLRGQ